VLRFGLDHKADIGADILEQRVDGSRFILSTPHGDAEVALPLPGRHNIANALAASAIALALDVPSTPSSKDWRRHWRWKVG
jgi:UDP-N-acetylmuramoyl-tripeptide--D-alanyl-D-alanine ligase